MILWISVIAALLLTGVAAAWLWRLVRPAREREERDPNWGEFPPDQMSI